jgi:O-antigen/teichoic acid export membrane protein
LAILLFGRDFAASGPILGWLGVAAGGGLALSVLSTHQVAAGRFARPLVAAVPMVALAVGLQVLLIPRYGALGAAWATAAAASLAALIAHGFDGPKALWSRSSDLLRMLAAALAGFWGTRAAAGLGAPSPADILGGAVVGGIVLMATGLASRSDLRELGARLFGPASLPRTT